MAAPVSTGESSAQVVIPTPAPMEAVEGVPAGAQSQAVFSCSYSVGPTTLPPGGGFITIEGTAPGASVVRIFADGNLEFFSGVMRDISATRLRHAVSIAVLMRPCGGSESRPSSQAPARCSAASPAE